MPKSKDKSKKSKSKKDKHKKSKKYSESSSESSSKSSSKSESSSNSNSGSESESESESDYSNSASSSQSSKNESNAPSDCECCGFCEICGAEEENNDSIKKFDFQWFKENFCKGEIYHGLLLNQKEQKKSLLQGKSVLYKYFYNVDKLYFILYDYLDIYFCVMTKDEVLEINQQLNPSLEFKDIFALINFLKENLIFKNKNLTLLIKEVEKHSTFNYEISFNSKLEVLKLKWIFKCEKIPKIYIEEFSQLIFINPVHNLLLGLGYLIQNETELQKNINMGINGGLSLEKGKIMVKCNYLGKKVGFNESIVELLNTSSCTVNGTKNTYVEAKSNGEVKINSNNINKGKNNKFGGHKKGGKVKYMEDSGNNNTEFSSDLVDNLEKNEGINGNKDKDKKKKKKAFL